MIVKNFKYSCLLIIISVIAAIIVGIICGGLNLGIDFTGGSIITYKMGTTFVPQADAGGAGHRLRAGQPGLRAV